MIEQTNKELLKFAAKAAQYNVKPRTNECEHVGLYFTLNGKNWNPLADDGDALRLAVDLYIEVAPACYSKDSVQVYMKDDNCITEMYDGDKYAATRKAIVRAAAHLGGIK